MHHGPCADLTRSGPGEIPAKKVKHVVIILKENHTFDNYFGSFPVRTVLDCSDLRILPRGIIRTPMPRGSPDRRPPPANSSSSRTSPRTSPMRGSFAYVITTTRMWPARPHR